MLSGIYRVIFQGPAGQGKGILFAKNGVLIGGDTAFVYDGTFQISGSQFTAKLHVVQDATSLQSVFGLLSDFHLDILGQVPSDQVFSSEGAVIGQPALRITAQGTKMHEAI
jgi:T3SS negative regulator,GrlR